ncbi:MAG: TerC family protein [Verrucomicrobia bacterium]|nr:TerC family protein [Verrucomicrobiota bacterium]
MLFAAALVTEPQTAWQWFVAIFNIVWIDIVLAGDNAVVIALAVRNLPPRQRMLGIVLGAGAAVLLRVGLTFVATQLLTVRFVQLVGGALILWIAIKLLKQNESAADEGGNGAAGLWQAVWMILVADVTMSLDNVLAVAGAARGHFGLLMFGLALSIPLVVFASNLISKLMAKYQIVVFVGAAILGKVGGEMMLTDKVVSSWLLPWWGEVTRATDASQAYVYLGWSVEALLCAGIFLLGWLRRKRPEAPEEARSA